MEFLRRQTLFTNIPSLSETQQNTFFNKKFNILKVKNNCGKAIMALHSWWKHYFIKVPPSNINTIYYIAQ